ncbi:MAG: ATP-binding cassette domain-containing protein [Candidatus Andersenbacteria bacterium]
MSVIQTTHLHREYKVHKKEPGLIGSMKSLVRREYKTVEAVKDVTLTIDEGELVGFIGPNGAGKTTTLKMLSGLLYPTSGTATVLGYTPWQRKKDFLKQFSLVMGQKAQLWWDLPLYDSLLLQRDIYEMNSDDFEVSLAELTELLELEEFLKVQVRKLSLGQRMRGELAAALIYRPKVLFLDEPTIGLDVVVQRKVREFIRTYNKRHNATIILTSHYLDDVRELAQRLIIIDHGTIYFDGLTEDLIANHVDHKRITLTFSAEVKEKALTSYGRVTSYSPLKASIQVPREQTTTWAAKMLTELPVEDISIEEPSLENVVRELFTKKDYA